MSSGATDRHAAIDEGVSSYLDLIRVCAAMVVVLTHLLPVLFGYRALPGSDAVIVFFVISGYVIAYAHEQRDVTADRFIINRLARLWSVLLPSLAISAAAFLMEQPTSGLGAFIVSSLQNAVFLGQNWGWSNSAPYNDPSWSLNYEAWYYAIFAAFVFTPRQWRWPVATVFASLAGPAIVALMPCWLVGAFLYHRRHHLQLSNAAAYCLFMACVLSYCAACWFDLHAHGRAWLGAMTSGHSYRLRASTGMIGDTVTACLFGGTIVAVHHMAAVNRVLARRRALTRRLSSRTFSCYLYHMPIFMVLYGGLGFGEGSRIQSIACIVAVVWLCIAFGRMTEARVSRWRDGLRIAFQALRPQAS